MHLFAIIAVIIALGIGAVYRPALMLWLVIIVGGFLYVAYQGVTEPPQFTQGD